MINNKILLIIYKNKLTNKNKDLMINKNRQNSKRKIFKC